MNNKETNHKRTSGGESPCQRSTKKVWLSAVKIEAVSQISKINTVLRGIEVERQHANLPCMFVSGTLLLIQTDFPSSLTCLASYIRFIGGSDDRPWQCSQIGADRMLCSQSGKHYVHLDCHNKAEDGRKENADQWVLWRFGRSRIDERENDSCRRLTVNSNMKIVQPR